MAYKSKEDMRAYQKKWYLDNKEARRLKLNTYNAAYKARNTKFIRRYKLLCGCSICGYKKSQYALDFHHLDSSLKDFNVSSLVGKSIKKIKSEIRKCVVVCANCHRELTYTKPL